MERWRQLRSGKGGGSKKPLLRILRMDDRAIIPTRGTEDSAGIDLYATNTLTLYPGDIRQVHTGIAMEIPCGYYGHLTARSSLGKIGIRVSAGCTVIDSDYRGEVLIYMINDGMYPYTIQAGDRVAQMVVQPYLYCEVVEAEGLSETQRGMGGFGSTGR